MGNKRNSMEISAWMNNNTFSYWFNRFYAIAISMFNYDGLPDSIDPRFIESTLFWNGNGVYFNDGPELGNLFLPSASAGTMNVYGIPTIRNAYSVDPAHTFKQLTDKDSVLIYDSFTRVPLAHSVKMYAMKLYNIDRTIDININAQKTPILIMCDPKQKLSLENAYMQYSGNMPVIFANVKNFNPDSIKTMTTEAPYISDRLQALKRQLIEECLVMMGVESNTNDKAERLVAAEIESNMGATEALRQNRLKARRYGFEQVNKMFGTNIKVNFNSALPLQQVIDQMERGENDAEIYNPTENDL